VKAVAPLVIPHRLVLAPEALLEGTTELAIAVRLLELVPVPK
jgi:MoxR-like ATPase